MKNTDWQIVMEIVTEALTLSGRQREIYLKDCFDKYPALICEIESLISEDIEAKSFFETPAAFRYAEFFEEKPVASVGEQIGNYRIIRELATGGMGAVYLAERIDGEFDQQVAVKILRREFDTAAIRHRFQREKEIQSKLKHPAIVRLMDAGTTDSGLPFLAVEYIDGEPVTQYCRRRKLPLDERLKLFKSICEPIAYAHRNLIVHRDLKPSNILVTADGEPKLLDFGISKLLTEGEIRETHGVTEMRIMTPEYASPEQVLGESANTATDIYSLGVILYELLTGHTPFEKELLKEKNNIFRVIVEKEPEQPSLSAGHRITNGQKMISDESRKFEAKTTDKTPAETRGKLNQTQPDNEVVINPKSLRGDLDNIILKTLRKEPERRYRTVEQLQNDLEHYLKGLPVSARPATFGYRALKFVKRNWISVALAGLFILVLFGGIILSLWQAEQTRAEAVKAQKISSFLQNVLNFSNPFWFSSNPERNRQATIRQAVDEAAEKVETELAGQPDVQAEIQLVLGMTYIGQGSYDNAENQLRLSKKRFTDVYGDNSSYTMRAAVVLADTLLLKGEYEEAEDLYKQAINVLENDRNQTIENTDKWLAIAECDLGLTFRYRGELRSAQKHLERGLFYAGRLTGAEKIISSIINNNLGLIEQDRGNFEEALRLYQISIEDATKITGGNSLEIGMTHTNIGNSLKQLGKYDEAVKHLQKSRDIFSGTVGEEHNYTLIPQIYLADIRYLRGDYDTARKEIEDVLKTQQKLFPNGHLEITRSQLVLGKIYTKSGLEKIGEAVLVKALEKRREVLGENSPKTAEIKMYLGENLFAQARFEEAKKILSEALLAFQKNYKENHPDVIKCRELIGKTADRN